MNSVPIMPLLFAFPITDIALVWDDWRQIPEASVPSTLLNHSYINTAPSVIMKDLSDRRITVSPTIKA